MASSEEYSEEEEEYVHPKNVPHFPGHERKSNTLPVWGNPLTMNLNPLILTNIQTSHYFKTNLSELKTYHEVVDEIYYKVQHLEPWEKGSRKTSGQTGMCGGVRGVGAGGIVSTPYCLLYKLFTLKLTRKQLIGLITHCDSPYIRGLGFMHIRYTQPPADLWGWFEPYMDDEEEIDPKAGGGQPITIGQMVRQLLTKLDWYDTLFPRIPVPIQISIDRSMAQRFPSHQLARGAPSAAATASERDWRRDEERSPPPSSRRRGGGDDDRDRDRDRDRKMGRRGDDRSRSRSRDRDVGGRRRGEYYSSRSERDRSRSRSRERDSRKDNRDYYNSSSSRGGSDRGSSRSHHRDHHQRSPPSASRSRRDDRR